MAGYTRMPWLSTLTAAAALYMHLVDRWPVSEAPSTLPPQWHNQQRLHCSLPCLIWAAKRRQAGRRIAGY